MKKLASVALFVIAMGVHGVANAGFYLGGDIAITSFDYSDIDNATGYQLGAGYRFDNNLAVELRYLDSGEADIDGSVPVDDLFPGATVSDMSLELSGYLATLSYAMPLGTQENSLDLFFRGGLYDTDTEASGTVTFSGGSSQSGTALEGTTGLTVGIGLEWMPTSAFGLRAAVDGLISNNDFAADNNVTVITIGTMFRFGN